MRPDSSSPFGVDFGHPRSTNRWRGSLDKRNAAVIHMNMTSDFYDHDGPGGKPTGVDGDEKMMLAMYKSMPDLHLTIGDMISDGDKVMCRNIWRWTDTASGKDAVSRLRALALRRRQDRRALGHSHAASRGYRVDKELMRFQGGCDDTRYWTFWQRGCCRTNRVSVRPLLRVRVVYE